MRQEGPFLGDLGVLQLGQGLSGMPPGSSALCKIRLMKFKTQWGGELDLTVDGSP